MSNPIVSIMTNKGEIQLELFEDRAPETVKNFLTYMNENFYDKTIFHRVIDGFMIQGGGFTEEMKQKTTRGPIHNEADNKVKNKKGTIAMARTSDIHSATAQFFINLTDNDFLDFKSSTPSGYGYCVFGSVISGMDVVEKIGKVKTTTKAGHQNVPQDAIVIQSIKKISQETK